MLSISAQAQLASDVIVVSGEFVDNGPVDATILEADYDARTLTVRLDGSSDPATLLIPEEAEIVLTGANNLERKIEIDELNVGDDIKIEGFEVDGVVHIRIVGAVLS
ncbi:MAG: hypothetical protein R3305_03850 [Gammaproteobacteria bacterium]|nr:hypothetical protein [Gammaproteobacteria bacterium]